MPKRIAIYIPAYNVSSTICQVLDRIPLELRDRAEIFVVDNASTDTTYLSVITYKKENDLHNLKIIRNKKNVGYGGSQKVAYSYAIEEGYDIVAMLHGDAQYAPEFLPILIEPVENGDADLVFGSRMTGDPRKGGMPLWKIIGNKMLTKFENAVLGTHLSEFHSGYRVFNVKALEQVPFEKCSNHYYFDTEILILFHIYGFRIDERSIPTHYGDESQTPSLMNLASYCLNIIYIMTKYYLHKKGIIKVPLFDRYKE